MHLGKYLQIPDPQALKGKAHTVKIPVQSLGMLWVSPSVREFKVPMIEAAEYMCFWGHLAFSSLSQVLGCTDSPRPDSPFDQEPRSSRQQHSGASS